MFKKCFGIKLYDVGGTIHNVQIRVWNVFSPTFWYKKIIFCNKTLSTDNSAWQYKIYSCYLLRLILFCWFGLCCLYRHVKRWSQNLPITANKKMIFGNIYTNIMCTFSMLAVATKLFVTNMLTFFDYAAVFLKILANQNDKIGLVLILLVLLFFLLFFFLKWTIIETFSFFSFFSYLLW